MSLWRLEWLRLLRTHRLLTIIGVYVFFGLTGPLTVRYLDRILGAVGTEGIVVEFPKPTPADGIAQFTGDASQIGLLVVVFVAASALAFDSRREMAVFLRSRVAGVHRILVPAFTMSAVAGVAGLVCGTLAAWYETAVLLGPVPAAAMLSGILYGALFLAFATAVVALSASLARGTLATAGISLGILLGMAVAAGIGGPRAGRWLPTSLTGAATDLLHTARPVDYLPAATVTLIATAACLWVAIVIAGRREI
jgi:ABC-2 type transport system permease protein